MAKELIIVPRDKPELYESLRKESAGRSEVEVILDRRRGDRRRAQADPGTERRGKERRTYDGAGALQTQGFVRITVGTPTPPAEISDEIRRTGPPIPRHVTGRVFTWTTTLNRYPPKAWRDLFVRTKDRSIDCSPYKARFYQSVLIFDSDEANLPIWMQFIDGWIRSANERYLKRLEAERRVREEQEFLSGDTRARLRDMAEKFKHL